MLTTSWTPDGAWIIDEHPKIKNLYMAIGGSGHGFKFLPVIGSWIADIVLQCEHTATDYNRFPSLATMKDEWKWGRPANMDVSNPRVVLQGRPIRDAEAALCMGRKPCLKL